MKMIKVKALVAMHDNGVQYQPGDEFEMEASLVPAHEKAGQVERVGRDETA